MMYANEDLGEDDFDKMQNKAFPKVWEKLGKDSGGLKEDDVPRAMSMMKDFM